MEAGCGRQIQAQFRQCRRRSAASRRGSFVLNVHKFRGMTMNIEAEIDELKRRVGDLEGAVNVLAGQLGKVHPQLSQHQQRTEERFDRIDGLVGQVVGRLDTVNAQVWSLRDDLPDLLRTALRGGEGASS
jgi:hypothetical protein